MPSATKPVRLWFDLARAGNFPSVASNVLAALLLSVSITEVTDAAFPSFLALPSLRVLALAIVAGCLVYAGGATFNDVFDAAFDARHRPQRAIPQKLVTRAGAAWVATIEMLLGLGLLILIGAAFAWALALAATILAYNWIHKRWIGSVVLMAGCRVLLACTLASLPGHAFSFPFLVWIVALFVYIVVLSLIARWEYKVAQASPPASVPKAGEDACATPKAAKLGRAVGRLLAFIPLIDALALLLMGGWIPAMACALAVPLGRWAQRLAAST